MSTHESRPLFIVNPVAGRGRGMVAMHRLSSGFGEPAEIRLSRAPGEPERLADAGACEGFAPIIGVGGDGTLNEIANGLLRHADPPPLGIMPTGSGNDLARALKLPNDPLRALHNILHGPSTAIDVGVCNRRYFLNVGGAGLDTAVVRSMQGRRSRLLTGKLAYLVQGVRELRRYENPEFRIQLDDTVLVTRSLLVAVANGRCFAGGMKICPDANVTDGLLDVCIAGDLSRRETLALIPTIYVGLHGRSDKVSFHRARMVRIDGPAGHDVQLDGEIVTTLPAEFSVLPRALRIAGWAPGRGLDTTSPRSR